MTDWQTSVLEQLRAGAPKPLKIRDLAQGLDLTAEADRQALKAAVHAMAADGRIIRVHGKRFALPETVADVDVVGRLTAHPDGYAFVRPDDARADQPDIYVHGSNRHGAMHGDKVAVRVLGRGRGDRLRGEVTRVLIRANSRVVGTFRTGRGAAVLVPENDRLAAIRIARKDVEGAVDGQKVVAEITDYPTDYVEAKGRIIEILGFAHEPGVETKVLLRKYGLSDEFPDAVLAEAETAPDRVLKRESAGRLDLRDLPMVTIDGPDAKDHDDAVSLELLDQGGYRLGVHIADVSHYVKPGTALDEEAYARATSVYLEDLVVPMLPHKLSNGICSLNAGVDRLAMSCIMHVDRRGHVTHYEIAPTVIHVQHRMVYDDVYEMLTTPDSPLHAEYGDWSDRLKEMDRLAQHLRRLRERRGSLMFDFPEASAEIDEQGVLADIVIRETNRAHQLIEEFMLIANETVARHMRDLDVPFVYRIHEPPKIDAINQFLDFVQSLGYRVTPREEVEPRDLQKISNLVRGTPEEHLVNMLMLRSLKQARYDDDNAGHFGLASKCYCHFTSPIRRYPDLIVHRMLYLVNEHGVDEARRRWGGRLGVIADHCSEMERVAMQADRESLRQKQILYMADRVGDHFAARITGVQRYGMFVETVNELAEGLVHISTLEDDYYELVEEEHCLEGRRSGKRYRLGDPLTVQVVRADVEQLEIDFQVVPAEEEEEPKARPERRRRPDRRQRERRTGKTEAKGRERAKDKHKRKPRGVAKAKPKAARKGKAKGSGTKRKGARTGGRRRR